MGDVFLEESQSAVFYSDNPVDRQDAVFDSGIVLLITFISAFLAQLLSPLIGELEDLLSLRNNPPSLQDIIY